MRVPGWVRTGHNAYLELPWRYKLESYNATVDVLSEFLIAKLKE